MRHRSVFDTNPRSFVETSGPKVAPAHQRSGDTASVHEPRRRRVSLTRRLPRRRHDGIGGVPTRPGERRPAPLALHRPKAERPTMLVDPSEIVGPATLRVPAQYATAVLAGRHTRPRGNLDDRSMTSIWARDRRRRRRRSRHVPERPKPAARSSKRLPIGANSSRSARRHLVATKGARQSRAPTKLDVETGESSRSRWKHVCYGLSAPWSRDGRHGGQRHDTVMAVYPPRAAA